MKKNMLRLGVFALTLSFLAPVFSQELNKDLNSSSIEQLSLIGKDVRIDIPSPQFSIEDTSLSSTCQYPNDNIHPGNDVAPYISDKRRVEAILDLIDKIAKCVKLPYKEDGQIFKNKEGKLPQMENGYYREYTLVLPKDAQQQFYIGQTQYTALPSLSERGPERIVIGGGSVIYYTPTHYASFVKIDITQSKFKDSKTENSK